jgi:hypothetical protein
MSANWLIDKYDYLMLKCAPWQKIQIQFDTYFLFFTYIQSRLQSCLILIVALTKTSELAHKLAKKLRKELARRGAYFTETDSEEDVIFQNIWKANLETTSRNLWLSAIRVSTVNTRALGVIARVFKRI